MIAVIISIFQTMCGVNMAITVYKKWKASIMFYSWWH